ncbi:MAG: dynamin family protein [Ectobacillus sp.]
MITIKQSHSLQKFLYLYEAWSRQGDTANSARLQEIIRKYANQGFMIAFCGHFSAGKSTMMNYLYGENLLPTSPIPTSANVVKIEHGADRVILTLKSGEKHAYEGTYTDEQLKQLCKNGDEVTGVHIMRQGAPLPKGVMLVDTPGIDSTDDAHKLATESALHLADVIFYMMDYNHVQSEVNLQFVKELKQRNKFVYLVVNQIDKHKDEELPFEVYKASVLQSFSNWNIEIDGIFYTSLRRQEHPFNELQSLKQLLAEIVEKRRGYMDESARKETEYLLNEHIRFLHKKHEQEDGAFQHGHSHPEASYEQIKSVLHKLYEEEHMLAHKENDVKSVFARGLDHILQNAYLLPFEVRALAERYLETELSNFKVGFFFSKSKTQKEKEERLHAFFEKFQQTAQTQLDFHIKEYLLSFLKEQGIYAEELGKEVYALSVAFNETLLQQLVKPGAGLTGEYVLNYTNDVAAAVKKMFRAAAVAFFDSQIPLLVERWNRELAKVRQQIHEQEQLLAKQEEMARHEQERSDYIKGLYRVWNEEQQAETTLTLESVLAEEVSITSAQPLLLPALEEAVVEREEEQVAALKMGTAEDTIHAIIEQVKRAENMIRPISTLHHLYEELSQKRQRTETKQFTVALFGAFSAGKSSFANALLGEKVLPVSPNPTTAAINKILPATTEHPHGTVRIQIKSRETLLEDLQQVYKMFEEHAGTLEEAVDGIDSLLQHHAPSGRQKTTFSFLRAVQAGYASFSKRLGHMLTTTIEEFAEYVANEEKSCFVEYMELYYDCEFTRKGITLVDTPGADSINARHTDVAFQYIKNADAILFVTYYNHVFSRADREFLIQLGRVKDSFALDKMFFLINAADLAASANELQTVKDYIAGQLLQYGIRNPRLFAISSLFALDEKTGKAVQPGQYGIMKQSGMQHFEEAFTSFMIRDLMLVSLTSLHSLLKGADRLLGNMIADALQGNEQKQAKRQKYEQERQAMAKLVSTYSVMTQEQALEQEIHELLYYVKQRIFFRFHDVFSEIFNPAAIRSDSSDVKQQLKDCVMAMIDFMKHDLLQEMRATSLRVESWMNKKLRFSQEELSKQCLELNEDIAFSGAEEFMYRSVVHEEPFMQLGVDQFKKAMSYFKNPKSFFEKNEKAYMQEEMKNIFDPLVSAYIETEQRILACHYKEEWETAWQNVKRVIMEDIMQHYEGVLYALSENMDVSFYQHAKMDLQQTVRAIDGEMQKL